MSTTTHPGAQPIATYGTVAHRSRGGAAIVLLSPCQYTEEPYGTSNHLGFSVNCPIVRSPITSWVTAPAPTLPTISEEVRQLRDHVIELTGLTRQEIARAIGVDRRSLSGYVTGEIRPTDERLRVLRELSDTAAWTAERFGERARELLRGTDSGASPLDLIGIGQPNIRNLLEAMAEDLLPPSPQILTVRRRTTSPPLHLHALAVSDENTNQPQRARTVRDESVYEQDPSKADHQSEPPPRPRRKNI